MKRWFNHLRARIRTFFCSHEWGGALYQYLPQTDELEELHRWQTEEEQQHTYKMVDELFDSEREEIRVAMSKTGHRSGYFTVHTSRLQVVEHHFWDDVFPMMEAFIDMKKSCQKFAKEMGYTGPRRDNEHS